MKFRSFVLSEMGRARVPDGETITIPTLPDASGKRSKVTVGPEDVIDMRFEDYGVKLGDFSPWQVQLPDGRWLVNHGMYNYEIAAEPGKYPRVPPEAVSKEDGKEHPWYDFMQVISGNHETKPALARPEGLA